MTIFSALWRVLTIMTKMFVVMVYFWNHDDLFRSHDVYFTSWRVFDVMTFILTSWRVCYFMANFLSSWRFWFHYVFLTSWWTFCRHDAFWCHNELSFDIMMHFPYFWCYDILFNLWRIFWRHDILSIFVWPRDVFLDLLFNVLMYFSTL